MLMTVTFAVSVPVVKTARMLQVSGIFDLPLTERSEHTWSVNLPLDEEVWQIGLIVGPSGSGKSTLAREVFGDSLVAGYDWPVDESVVDGFPAELSIRDITSALSSVGFSTPPAWLRPFRCLSNGEQFRATLARALLDPRRLVVVDEFTSVVDRTVAQIGSAAVAKAVRHQPTRQFVAATCHADVEEWLCPDWVIEMPSGSFTRRLLRKRPAIELQIYRVNRSAWNRFKHHHYLNTVLNPAAVCFVAFWRSRPVAFASALPAPGRVTCWREHRTVCLPDFQGVGIGNALSEFVAGVMKATGKPYRSTTANPAMIRHRLRSPLWRMTRGPGTRIGWDGKAGTGVAKHLNQTRASNRLTVGFEYIGPKRVEDARRFGVR
jgi:ABC-type lipoprotein export system ATPase subunit